MSGENRNRTPVRADVQSETNWRWTGAQRLFLSPSRITCWRVRSSGWLESLRHFFSFREKQERERRRKNEKSSLWRQSILSSSRPEEESTSLLCFSCWMVDVTRVSWPFLRFSGRREEATLIVACTHTTHCMCVFISFNRVFFFFRSLAEIWTISSKRISAAMGVFAHVNVLTFAKMTCLQEVGEK